MTKIPPPQAANLTEALWKARAEGRESDAYCGWCEFHSQISSSVCSPSHCPVRRVAKVPCHFMAAYNDYQRASADEERREAAAVIYDLLVENRERLIAAAEEILDEARC